MSTTLPSALTDMPCQGCGVPLGADPRAVVHIDLGDVNAARAGEGPALWMAHCSKCNPHMTITGDSAEWCPNCYCCNPRHPIDWDAHLRGKTWTTWTNWVQFFGVR